MSLSQIVNCLACMESFTSVDGALADRDETLENDGSIAIDGTDVLTNFIETIFVAVQTWSPTSRAICCICNTFWSDSRA